MKSLYIQNVTSSPCASEWEECVGEDEMFLETTTFYDDCDIASSADALQNGILESVAANKCSENRRCDNRQKAGDDTAFVGFDPFGNCTCPKTTATKRNARVLYTFDGRFKRQTGETYTTGGNPICRVQRPRRGRRRVMCDMLINVRSQRYERSNKIAVLQDSTFNIVQDPAICGLFSDNCL